MKKEVLTFLFLFSIITVSFAVPVKAGSGPTLSAWTSAPPTINGVLAPGEWDAASTQTFTLGGWTNCKVYVMNDANNLYVALEIPDTTESSSDYCYIFFENDHDEVTELGDDMLRCGGTPPGIFYDYYCSTTPGTYSWDTSDGGFNDGSSVLTADGVFHYYEFSHPLDTTDDTHDFSLTLGSTVGFYISYRDAGTVVGNWPSYEPEEMGNIIIASPPTLEPLEPVGGDVFQIDKLAVLTPYILIVMVLLSASLLIKKRRY